MRILPKFHFPTFHCRRSIRDFFLNKKEGVITGAADNDPCGVITYFQTGAMTGYGLLWLLIISTPMLIAVEEMSVRVAVILKKGLGRVLADYYGLRWTALLVLLVTIANTGTIAANIAGMSDVLSLVFGMEEYRLCFVLLLGLVILLMLLRGGYQSVSRYLYLLTPVFLAYVASAFLAHPDWQAVWRDGLIPRWHFSTTYWTMAVALLGTTITPFVAFWETTEDVEARKKFWEMRKSKIAVRTGMIYSNIIAAFMIILTATIFYGSGSNVENVGQLAKVLQPLVGDASFALFSVGLIGAGLLAVPVLAASTAYMVTDAFGQRGGLDEAQDRAPLFYGVIVLALAVGMWVTAAGVNPIQMIIYSQVVAGMVMPFLVWAVYRIVNDRETMREHVNSRHANIVIIFTLIVLIAANALLVVDLIK